LNIERLVESLTLDFLVLAGERGLRLDIVDLHRLHHGLPLLVLLVVHRVLLQPLLLHFVVVDHVSHHVPRAAVPSAGLRHRHRLVQG